MPKAKKKKPKKAATPNWPRLERKFLTGKTANLKTFAAENKLKYSTVKKQSANRKWVQKRAQVEPAAMQKAREKIIGELAEDAVVRMRGWLQVADALKAKAVQALIARGAEMSIADAVKSIHEAVSLEGRIFGMDGHGQGNKASDAQPADPAAGTTINNTQINIEAHQQNVQLEHHNRAEIQSSLDRISTRSETQKVSGKPDA